MVSRKKPAGSPTLPSNDQGFAVDVAALCAVEEIQFLGEVQAHGFLFELSSDWIVRRASANLPEFIARDPSDVIGMTAVDVLGRGTLHDLRSQLQIGDAYSSVEALLGAQLPGSDDRFDLRIHRVGDNLIVEGERAVADGKGQQTDVQMMLVQLQRMRAVDEIARAAVRHVRALSGYDRVMCYRFHDDDTGEVIAETRRSGLDPFLGLRYPATDIPPQARSLYLRNPIRVINDVHARTSPVEPRIDVHGHRLDLSLSDLRAVSPTHIQYLKNMDVAASMSLSIVVDGKLWGLIACHHQAARSLSLSARQGLAFYASVLSSTIELSLRGEVLRMQSNARELHVRMLSRVSSESASIDDLFPFMIEIAGEIGATGVAMYVDGRLKLHGATLGEEQTLAVMRFLNGTAASKVYHTHRLSAVVPFALGSDEVAGILAVPVSRRPRDYVMFCRRELASTIRWAGDPDKVAAKTNDGIMRLSPRASFAEWQQVVRGQAQPFTGADLEFAEALRVSLLEAMLQVTDAAEKQRRVTNDRQDLLISELNHRVRNILGLIVGLVRQCAEGAPDVATFSEEVNARLLALARAHDQLTSDGWGARSMTQMIQVEAGAYLGDMAQRVIVTGDEVAIQPDAFATVALVVHELITNAAKYGALRDSQGKVLIDLAFDPDTGLSLRWKEQGGAEVKQPTRRGFGSTIIERAIPHEIGGSAHVAFEPDGLRADFVIPNGYVTLGTAETAAPPSALSGSGPSALERLDGEILLVEDNLLIALEVESMLISLGASDVQVSSNVSSALDYLGLRRPDFAILDVNLGREQSTPVAAKLAAMEIPFIFATGYGDTAMIPAEFRDRPVLTKPYSATNVLAGFQRQAG